MDYDFCIIGGGIIGLWTAYELATRHPSARIILFEKENALGQHQSGHNSGVIHTGIYYKPGSFKATLCRRGSQLTQQFCDKHGIDYDLRGKLVVATNELEVARLNALEANADKNQIEVRRLSGRDLTQLEPRIRGEAALLVPGSGIVDYRRICEVLGDLLMHSGVEVVLGAEINAISEQPDAVEIACDKEKWSARQLIICAGLQADRMAKLSGMKLDFQIIPFRGEYYRVRPERADLVHHLIYPVPDPALPFLGIHLTPTIDGDLTIGPNAVISFARERYEKFSFNAGDVASFLAFPGFWRVARSHWKSAISEMSNSLFKSVYLRECQKYCADLELGDLLPHRPGIRAQAVLEDGTLLHDFLFLSSSRILHVGSAPSPAATSAQPIGEMIADKLGSSSTAAIA